MNTPKLIGLSGFMGSGKSTAAKYLAQNYGYEIVSFAGALKESAAIAFGVDLKVFLDEEEKKKVDPFWGITRREMLQKFGTECMRNVFFQDFWTRRVDMVIQKQPDQIFIIDDVRFENEVDWVYSKGGLVILIERDGVVGSSHASEQGISKYHYKVTNNDSVQTLHKAMDSILDYEHATN